MGLKASTNVLVENFGDESVVYDLGSKQAHNLNKSLKWIWEQCDGTKTADDITAAFQMHFGATDASSLVASGLEQLIAANLVSGASVPEGQGTRGDTTRRQAVAAASLLAPVITSIVAPTPAAAKSKEEKDKPPKDEKPPKIKFR